jgi:hypothetical protein
MDINNLNGLDFRGCVLIQKGNETVFQKSFGYADLHNRFQMKTIQNLRRHLQVRFLLLLEYCS